MGRDLIGERAAHAGGSVRVDSAPGKGTEITIEFPQDGTNDNG